MTACQLDGSEREVLEQGPGWMVLRCPYCQTVSREEVIYEGERP